MSSNESGLSLREQAIALRRSGRSRRQIKAVLGIGNTRLDQALKGIPPPVWTRRPNAKDDQRQKARALRAAGMTYEGIAAELGVSKSSISLWVRDLPSPEPLSYEECIRRAAAGRRRYWEHERPLREARREMVRMSAAADIGELSDREILIAGAIAYWCEGSKSKPHRRTDRVAFMNSNPELIKFFMHFLDVAGIQAERLVFSVYIHENADLEAARRFWLGVTRADASQFRATTLKRHNPRTVRKNIGVDYHGCLRVEVRHGAELYQRIEGWVRGATTGGRTSRQVSSQPASQGPTTKRR